MAKQFADSSPALCPRWLNAAQMRAWRTYVEVSARLALALESDLASTGLSQGDYQVLVFLSEAPDQQMRMCDLASVLQLSPSGLTRRLDGLVSDGLVSRQASDSDRRVMLAVLTDRGRTALERAAPLHVESVQRRIFDRLDHTQVTVLAQIFSEIGSGLDAEQR
jgi:DNA-binding MarR family transcriptional regulator